MEPQSMRPNISFLLISELPLIFQSSGIDEYKYVSIVYHTLETITTQFYSPFKIVHFIHLI